MSELELLKFFLPFISGGTLVALAIFFYLFSKPEKFDQWGLLLYKFFRFVGGRVVSLRGRIDRGVIAWDIQAAVNTTGEALSREAPGILPYSLRVQWVTKADRETFIRSGEVVVRLSRHENQEKNLVAAAYAYAQKSLLPRARSYLDVPLREASNLTVVRKILGQARREGAYEYFYTTILKPAIDQNSKVQSDCTLLENLDSVGLLTRVFFYEVRQFGDRVYPSLPSEKDHKELRAFAEFLGEIAGKESGEDVRLEFEGHRLKTGVILIARPGKLQREGIRPYVRRIAIDVRRGLESIFVCGWGEEYRKAVRETVRAARKGRLIEVLRSYEFPISTRKELLGRGMMFVSQASPRFRLEQRERERPVRNALLRHVPELADGKVQIVSVAREPGVGCKVAVRFGSEDIDPREAVRICIGESGERHRLIKNALRRGEWLKIIPWRSDLEEYIREGLACDPQDVLSIEIIELDLMARVLLRNKHAASRAIGKDGINIHMSEQLVGLTIDVELPSEEVPQ